MNCIKYTSLVVFIFSLTTFSQTNNLADDKLSLNSGTIDSQFEYIIQRSNNYQDHKVIKKEWLYTLKAHTLDSLNAAHKNLLDAKVVLNNQAKEITNLKLYLAETKNKLDRIDLKKNSMSLFGLKMSKNSYNVLMWFIIIGLLSILIFFFYKFKNSNIITKATKKTLVDVEEEFEVHRRVALEREQKVRRQLQDEINKNKKPKNN